MLNPTLLSILSFLLDFAHWFVFIAFWVCFIRIFLLKKAPHSSFYVASVCFVQGVYNGCPISDLQSVVEINRGNERLANSFILGGNSDYNYIFRILLILISIFIFYSSYINWKKLPILIDLNKFLIKGTT